MSCPLAFPSLDGCHYDLVANTEYLPCLFFFCSSSSPGTPGIPRKVLWEFPYHTSSSWSGGIICRKRGRKRSGRSGGKDFLCSFLYTLRLEKARADRISPDPSWANCRHQRPQDSIPSLLLSRNPGHHIQMDGHKKTKEKEVQVAGGAGVGGGGEEDSSV